MLVQSLLLLVSLVTPVWATSAVESAYDRAEVRRLSEELQKLARREAWRGVERFYQSILATPGNPSFDDHVAAAHAAASRGEFEAVRFRLVAAHNLAEDREVIEWMWFIDNSFGEVDVLAAGDRMLRVERLPFDRSKVAAVEFAQEAIQEAGRFSGLLPEGR